MKIIISAFFISFIAFNIVFSNTLTEGRPSPLICESGSNCLVNIYVPSHINPQTSSENEKWWSTNLDLRTKSVDSTTYTGDNSPPPPPLVTDIPSQSYPDGSQLLSGPPVKPPVSLRPPQPYLRGYKVSMNLVPDHKFASA
ncbi:hypothetical protein PIB30_031170 [Stylosanthes scabra]|uniref:Uncharacterized protein n=1 Tax=Stylosanthes scabra TaxID=79078 RepID=A0ABU6ZBX9_9FABA|nr:hypothetical protein [Stylosanthes scabra]